MSGLVSASSTKLVTSGAIPCSKVAGKWLFSAPRTGPLGAFRAGAARRHDRCGSAPDRRRQPGRSDARPEPRFAQGPFQQIVLAAADDRGRSATHHAGGPRQP